MGERRIVMIGKTNPMDIPANPFKRAIKAGRQQIGLWSSLSSHITVEVIAGSAIATRYCCAWAGVATMAAARGRSSRAAAAWLRIAVFILLHSSGLLWVHFRRARVNEG